HRVAGRGTAIIFGNDQVLGNIHQATCQVTRVSRFQRRIGQTLTSTVSGNKVLQDVQAFTEVGGNRRLNNRAVRLCHQTTHPRQLTDLGGRAPRARVSHHVDGVERLLTDRKSTRLNSSHVK